MRNPFLEQAKIHRMSREDKPAFSWINRSGDISESLSWSQLSTRTNGVSHYLMNSGHIRPGDRVLLIFPPGLDFVIAFLACLESGIVPVPLPPPNPVKAGRYNDMVNKVIVQTKSKVVLTTGIFRRLRHLYELKQRFTDSSGLPACTWLDISGSHDYQGMTYIRKEPDSDLAFLQYTSGSTSSPKGVMIGFDNLFHQCTWIRKALDMSPDRSMLSWLPHFHDYSLIGGIILNYFCGSGIFLQSPVDFLRDPVIWFNAVGRYNITHTAAPNFAFDFLLDRATEADIKQWHLESLRIIMSAGEPVRQKTCQRFTQTLHPRGLSKTVFFPAYGLAEHTVGVSVGGRQTLAVDQDVLATEQKIIPREGGPVLTGLGKPGPDVKIRIVDPDTRRIVSDQQIGEIWVSSPSKTSGYFNLPEETIRTFHATIEGWPEKDEFLRTGDLGFLYKEEVFITGRIKDLIIVNGKNHYPQDIEYDLMEALPDIRPGGIAVFSINQDNRDLLITLAEVRKNAKKSELNNLKENIIRYLNRNFPDVSVRAIAGKKGMIEKTTSGKLRRSYYKDCYLRGMYSS